MENFVVFHKPAKTVYLYGYGKAQPTIKFDFLFLSSPFQMTRPNALKVYVK